MRHFIMALLATSVPAAAAPAHRQPTQATLQASAKHGSATETAPTYKDLMAQSARDQSFKSVEFNPKVTKAIGAICSGC
jgi:hypothetical protein